MDGLTDRMTLSGIELLGQLKIGPQMLYIVMATLNMNKGRVKKSIKSEPQFTQGGSDQKSPRFTSLNIFFFKIKA